MTNTSTLRAEVPAFKTLCDLMKHVSEQHGASQIVHVSPRDASEDRQSYADLAHEARCLAADMMAKGWKPGDRLIFVINDSRLFVTCFWACVLAGIVPAPLSPLPNQEANSMEADKILNVMGILEAPVLMDSRLHQHASIIEGLAAQKSGYVLYADELLRDARVVGDDKAKNECDLPHRAPSDVAVLQFSSGSSGMPKGVLLTHANIIANVRAQLEFTRATQDDVVCTWLPYFHDFGLFWGHIFPLYRGMTQVHVDPGHFARRPLVWLEKIDAHRATMTNSTPTALKHLNDYIELKQKKSPIGPYDLSSLKTMFLGAEMIDPEDCRRAIRLLTPSGCPPELLQGGYGLTETTMVATACQIGTPFRTRIVNRKELVSRGQVVDVPADDPDAVEFTSVGKPLPYCEVRVVDEQGTPVGADRAGIVEIRGENVTRGYYENPEADRQAFLHDGWFSSGDIGFLDGEGYLTITGRAKEMIIVGGSNYYPWDIEQIAERAPGAKENIRHLTVCGMWNSALHREEIIVFHVPGKADDKTLGQTLSAISAHVNEVAGFPVDAFVRLQMKEVPRTSSGKVMRRVLLERLADGTHQRMDLTYASNEIPQKPEKRSHEDMQHMLRGIWSAALGVSPDAISGNTSLFSLGCNSLMAYHIQGRLEDALGQRLETNFNYAHPVFDDQVRLLVAIDPSLDAPDNEIEFILRTVVHDVLGVPERDISVTRPLTAFTRGLSDAVRLLEEAGRVFALDASQRAGLRGDTIRALATEIAGMSGIGAGSAQKHFPLMNFQETLYFHRKGFVRNEPSRLSCFIFIDLDIVPLAEAHVDADVLSRAFDRVIAQNPILRGVIDETGERPFLRILDDVPPFRVAYQDLSGMDEEEADQYLLERGRDINDIRFDIGRWPMFVAELYRKPDGRFRLLFNIDHLLIDGYSFMHMVQEVLQTYESLRFGLDMPAAQTALSFGDYVLIEAARQRTTSYQRAMARQLSLFDNLPTKPALPGRMDPASMEDVWFDTYYHMLDADLAKALTSRAAANGLTLNSLLLAVWFKIVNLWSGQNDLIINMPVFNREQYFHGARSVIGTFIDIFPVRVRTQPSEDVITLARKVEGFTRELLSVPVSSIELSRLIAERDRNTSGSMSSLIFSNSIGVYGGDLKKIRKIDVERPMFRTGAPGTTIDLVLYDYEGEYYINWNYIRDLFDASFIQTLATQFLEVCRTVAHDASSAGSRSFDVMSVMPVGFRKILLANNDTRRDFPQDSIPGLVARQALATPDSVALRDGTRPLTYRELIAGASQIAHLLRKTAGEPARRVASPANDTTDAGTNPFIALLFERSIEMLVAQLGVMMAGHAWVPIDPEYPPERMAHVLDDCQASVVIAQQHLLGRIPSARPHLRVAIIVDAQREDAAQGSGLTVLDTRDVAQMPSDTPSGMPGPDHLAYMLYTSGSTGMPKGVMIPHRGIVNFLSWVRRFHDLTERDQVALVTSYAFDMTMATNWTPLLCGACIHILHEAKTRDVETLLRFLSERQISFLNVTPSQFSLLSSAREHLSLGELPMVPSMRIMLGGEVINTRDISNWLRHYPGHVFVNEYGPTEVSVATTAFTIPADQDGQVTMAPIPIGKPLDNCTAYVLSDCGQPCMPGVAGELCLGGVGVAQGYFNKPDRTAAAFVDDPFQPPGARMYRTGDMARIWDDGNIEFLGRQDHQINLKGFRIEAGEVEHALVAHPAVLQAVVSDQPDATGQRQLVAHVTASSPISAVELRKMLGNKLPSYMVPSHIVQLDALPTTPSGKLDRKALPVIAASDTPHIRSGRPPESRLEHALCAIWQETLGISNIGMDDNFWDLGGDSLRAMRLILRYREAGLQDFGLKDVFRFQTIGETARALEGKRAPADNTLVSVLREGDHPRCRLLLLPYACGSASSFVELSRHLPDDFRVLSITPPEAWTTDGTDISGMARQIIDALALHEDGLPLLVAGYSFGGVLGCELVRQFEAAGNAPGAVSLIAAAPPGAHQEIDLILSADDESIIRYSRDVYGFDTTLLSDAELASYLRQLRAQTRAMARHRFDEGLRLKTPLLSLVGTEEEDSELSASHERWGELFVTSEHEKLPGGHMLVKTHAKALAERLARFFSAFPSAHPASGRS